MHRRVLDPLRLVFIMLSLALSVTTRKLITRHGTTALRNASMRLLSAISSTTSSYSKGHLAVHVRGKLQPDTQSAFLKQTLKNARESVQEKGISRFDVLTGENDEFLLVEVYNSDKGPAEHKETAHYAEWRDVVAPFMAQPREASKYQTLFPPSSHWMTPPAASDIGEETSYLQV